MHIYICDFLILNSKRSISTRTKTSVDYTNANQSSRSCVLYDLTVQLILFRITGST